MDDKRLAEIRARVDAATPGPWTVIHDARTHWDRKGNEYPGGYHVLESQQLGDMECGAMFKADAVFVCHARQDIPDLLAALDAARADVARLREIERYARQVAGHFGDGANNCPTCLTPRGHRDDCPYEHLWRLLAATEAQP